MNDPKLSSATQTETAPPVSAPIGEEKPPRALDWKKRKRRLGDRKDGRRLRTLAPYFGILPYFMVERNDASNYFSDSFDITAVEQYVKEKKAQGLKNFGIMHVLIAAYVRQLARRPRLNRFLSGSKIYFRKGIVVNLVVKPEMSENAVDTAVKMYFKPGHTATEVYEIIQSTIHEALSAEENPFDAVARILNYIPGLVKKFAVWFLKMLDYFGLLPSFLTGVSPFHGSMIITSMGSLGIPPIYHHLYNFGNIPVFLSFGRKETKYVTQADGSVRKQRYVDYKLVIDERICDGFYYASALKVFKKILENPWVLDEELTEIVEDQD